MSLNLISDWLQNANLLNDETLPLLEKMTIEYPASGIVWGLYLKNLENLSDPQYDSSLRQVAVRVTDRSWLKSMIIAKPHTLSRSLSELYLEISDYQLGPDNLHNLPNSNMGPENMSLIDSFLASGATFNHHESADRPNRTKEIVDRADTISDDIVTEGFANLLFAQGNLPKALEAFEKLSFKFPEKSIYFAARVEEIKNLLNQ